ncbi:hypothetical protein TNCV_3240041 [Trichonephila clavipes]|nr:hypothetical protein TNCV_3240041 [Trichonephila clavipes]
MMVLCTRSTALLWGWLTDDLVTLMPNLLKKVVVNSLVKRSPQVGLYFARESNLEKILKRASITFGEGRLALCACLIAVIAYYGLPFLKLTLPRPGALPPENSQAPHAYKDPCSRARYFTTTKMS